MITASLVAKNLTTTTIFTALHASSNVEGCSVDSKFFTAATSILLRVPFYVPFHCNQEDAVNKMDEQIPTRQDANANIRKIDFARKESVLSGLPPKNTKRWVIRRKAAVVAAVKNGAITREEACQRYNLSVEEFLTWQQTIEKHGIRGLRVTRLQDYRTSQR